jgi:8-oxo-dGTP pyrophosphatase MutT (NUDIX family)
MELSSLNAVGVWFRSSESRRYLYLLRNDNKHPGTWGLPGGKQELNETLLGCMERECIEELGFFPNYQKLIPVEKFTSADGEFIYHTFICIVEKEFVPTLNNEHYGYAWIDSGVWPRPLHPGLWNMVNIESVKNKILFFEQDLIFQNTNNN